MYCDEFREKGVFDSLQWLITMKPITLCICKPWNEKDGQKSK